MKQNTWTVNNVLQHELYITFVFDKRKLELKNQS